MVSLSRKRHPVQNKRSRNDRNLLSLNRCHRASTLLSIIDLNFCVINAQSLNNKASEFIDFVCEYKPDIVAIYETWFTNMESASCTLCTPLKYKLLDHPRSNRRGGGTGILFRDNLSVSKSAAAELQSFEYSEWDINCRTQRIHLNVFYRSPYSYIHTLFI